MINYIGKVTDVLWPKKSFVEPGDPVAKGFAAAAMS
jgi:hypothetical protein